MRVWSAVIVAGGLLLTGCAVSGYPGGDVYGGSAYGYGPGPFADSGYAHGYQPAYVAPYAYPPGYIEQPYGYYRRRDYDHRDYDYRGGGHDWNRRVTERTPPPQYHAPPPPAHAPDARTRNFMANMGFTPNH